jgi:F-type H+/Na+-transporting ATPase subunit alpha
MPVEDQVVQVYAATNGYLDRIVVDKVDRFLAELTESVRGNESELLEKIAGGDWSDETQQAVESAVSRFAEDFGFDLDEEGHPIEDDTPEPSRNGGNRQRDGGDSEREDGDRERESGDREREEQAQPA